MSKFTYSSYNDCLVLKDEKGNLIDYKFYNKESIKSLSIAEWLEMIKEDIKQIALKNNIVNYIYNLLEE